MCSALLKTQGELFFFEENGGRFSGFDWLDLFPVWKIQNTLEKTILSMIFGPVANLTCSDIANVSTLNVPQLFHGTVPLTFRGTVPLMLQGMINPYQYTSSRYLVPTFTRNYTPASCRFCTFTFSRYPARWASMSPSSSSIENSFRRGTWSESSATAWRMSETSQQIISHDMYGNLRRT